MTEQVYNIIISYKSITTMKQRRSTFILSNKILLVLIIFYKVNCIPVQTYNNILFKYYIILYYVYYIRNVSIIKLGILKKCILFLVMW